MKMHSALSALFLALSLTALPACQTLKPHAIEAAADFDYAALLEEGTSPEEDTKRYAERKTLELMQFTGAAPGMTIIDLEAGDGINTELFSYIAGPSGKVYLQNPKEFDRWVSDALTRRLGGGRLANVESVKTPFDALNFADTSEADLVAWFMGPHELWYTPEGAEPGALGNPEKAFLEIARVLKRGGTFVVLDHDAPDGAPATTGGDTHRLNKALLIESARKAGLVLIDESSLFANPDDPGTANVFDTAIKGKTDRYLLKFRKK